MDKFFSAGKTIFEAFIQDILSMSIKFLPALFLVLSRSLFNVGPAFLFSSGVEILRINE